MTILKCPRRNGRCPRTPQHGDTSRFDSRPSPRGQRPLWPPWPWLRVQKLKRPQRNSRCPHTPQDSPNTGTLADLIPAPSPRGHWPFWPPWPWPGVQKLTSPRRNGWCPHTPQDSPTTGAPANSTPAPYPRGQWPFWPPWPWPRLQKLKCPRRNDRCPRTPQDFSNTGTLADSTPPPPFSRAFIAWWHSENIRELVLPAFPSSLLPTAINGMDMDIAQTPADSSVLEGEREISFWNSSVSPMIWRF